MVSSTLCPAVHILGSQNVYSRAEGIADHYWPGAVFFINSAYKPEQLGSFSLIHLKLRSEVVRFFFIGKMVAMGQ